MNLIALLLDARRPVPVGRVREALYSGESDLAFRKKFERDREELAEAGIPVERVAIDAWGDEGYIIPKDEALLDDPGLTPDEQAALSLAAQAWEAKGTGPATALLKLSLASGVREGGGGSWILPRLEPQPSLEALTDAILRRKRTTFRYRTGGAGEPQSRTVDPHALRFRAGSWYLAGFDHQRREVRNFKVARLEGRVALAPGPGPDFDPPPSPEVVLPTTPWEGEAETSAVVAFAPDVAWWAERRTGARRLRERDDAWVEFEIPVSDRAAFASWVLGFADDAAVVSPDDLRAEVAGRLRELARA